MFQCPTCGSNVLEGAEVCPDCGMDLKGVARPSTTPFSSFEAFDEDQGETFESGPAPLAAAKQKAGTNLLDPDQTPTPGELAHGEPAADALESLAAMSDDEEGIVATEEPASAASGMAGPEASTLATLTLKRGGALTNETFALGGRVVVGRFDPDSGPVDVDLGPLPEASYISRYHAELWPDENGQWFVKDLGSRNGSFLRGAGAARFGRISDEMPVNDGDEIALGNARFEFRVNDLG